jgi:hypothetical protein
MPRVLARIVAAVAIVCGAMIALLAIIDGSDSAPAQAPSAATPISQPPASASTRSAYSAFRRDAAVTDVPPHVPLATASRLLAEQDSLLVYLVEDPPDHSDQSCLVVLDESAKVGATACGDMATVANRPPWIILGNDNPPGTGDIIGIAPDGIDRVTFTAADGQNVSAQVNENVFRLRDVGVMNVAVPRAVSYSGPNGIQMRVLPRS